MNYVLRTPEGKVPVTETDYDRILREAEQKVFNIDIQRNNDPVILLSGIDPIVYAGRMAYYDKLISDVRAEAQIRANATLRE